MATDNLPTSVISRLMSEIRDLVKNPPDGIRYVENESNSISEIHAIIDGPGKFHTCGMLYQYHSSRHQILNILIFPL
jgi:ubiquitin-protein ligase